MAGVGRADSAVPLYHQIFLTIRDEIISGKRPFGAAVPTEAELSEAHDVSRITARRALDELAQHRLVERKRRVGTRVIFRSPVKPIEGSIDQAVESLIEFGRTTKVRVVEIVREDASPDVAASLQMAPGESVVRAVRLRLLDGEPLGQVVSYVPARLAALMTKTNLSKRPMLDLLRSNGHAIGDARQSIAAVLADAALAAALDIEVRAAVLHIDRVVSDKAGQPLLATIADYRADRYRINLDLHGLVGRKRG